MLAIHYQKGNNFSQYWKDYLDKNNIQYRIVNAYDSNIIKQLEDCKFFIWHINNLNYRDQIFAKFLLNAIEARGIIVFPNFKTNWHFDDKVAQKYLFEALELPLVETHVFYNKWDALEWANETDFPKVFKLRKGSGSKGVVLAKTKSDAIKLINRAFGVGFKTISTWFLLNERIRKFKLGNDTLFGILKAIIRLFISTEYIRMSTREKGYVYFQKFIPANNFDIRVVIIGNRAFGIKRMNRKNDFRASGSGHIIYDKDQIDLECIKLAFYSNSKLNMQCAAFDFVYDETGNPLIVEVSYGFNSLGYKNCEGWWDNNLNWNDEIIEPENWMIQDLLKDVL